MYTFSLDLALSFTEFVIIKKAFIVNCFRWRRKSTVGCGRAWLPDPTVWIQKGVQRYGQHWFHCRQVHYSIAYVCYTKTFINNEQMLFAFFSNKTIFWFQSMSRLKLIDIQYNVHLIIAIIYSKTASFENCI